MNIKNKFKSSIGFNANHGNVSNVLNPVDKFDAVNLDHFDYYNTVQEYSKDKGYPLGFVVMYNEKLYYSNSEIDSPAGEFNIRKWKPVSTSPQWVSVEVSPEDGYKLKSGDYIVYNSSRRKLTFKLPDEAENGDTITMTDIGEKSGINGIVINSSLNNINKNGLISKQKFISIPRSNTNFVYLNNFWYMSQSKYDNNYHNKEVKTEEFFAQSGDVLFRRSQVIPIKIYLPEYAVDGDLIEAYDIDRMTSINPVTYVVSNKDHTINQKDKEFVLKTIGNEKLVYDERNKTWNIWDGDIRTRLSIVRDDVDLKPNENVVVYTDNDSDGEQQVINLQLPSKARHGDVVEISLLYLRKNQKAVIKAGENSTISTQKNKIQFPLFSEKFHEEHWWNTKELVFEGINDYNPSMRLSFYDDSNFSGKNYWVLVNFEPTIEQIDSKNRDRLGVISLANTKEVNDVNAKVDNKVVTPKLLNERKANYKLHGLARIATSDEVKTGKLSNVIVSPLGLNDRKATNELDGIISIATQLEVDGATIDNKAVTPLTLDKKRPDENGKFGVVTLTPTTGTKSPTERGKTGTNVYDFNDGVKVITPKSLTQLRSNEFALGLVYKATDTEVINGVDFDPFKPIYIHPESLNKRTATESRTGIAKLATTKEMLDVNENTTIVTPKHLRDVVSTETLSGLVKLANKKEVDEKSKTTAVSPFRMNEKLSSVKLSTNNESIIIEGDMWSGTTIDIKDSSVGVKGLNDIASDEDVLARKGNGTLTPVNIINLKGNVDNFGIVKRYKHDDSKPITDEESYTSPKCIKNLVTTSKDLYTTNKTFGTVRLSTIEESFVGDNLVGSSKPHLDYLDDISITPRSLNFALEHFLPKTAKAKDSEKIDGNSSSNLFLLNRDNKVKTPQTFEKINVNDLNYTGDKLNVKNIEVENISFGTDPKHSITSDENNIIINGVKFDKKGGVIESDNIITDKTTTEQVITKDGVNLVQHNKTNNEVIVGDKTKETILTTKDKVYIVNEKGEKGHLIDSNNIVNAINDKFVDLDKSQVITGQKKFDDGLLFGDEPKSGFSIYEIKTGFDKFPPKSYEKRTEENGKSVYVNPVYGSGILEKHSVNGNGFEKWYPFDSYKSYIRKQNGGEFSEWDEIYSTFNKPLPSDLGALSIEDIGFNDLTVKNFLDIIADEKTGERLRIYSDKETRSVKFAWLSEK